MRRGRSGRSPSSRPSWSPRASSSDCGCSHHRRLFADDYLAIAALLILIGNSAVMTLMAPSMHEIIAVSAGVAAPPPTFLDDSSFYLELQFASTVLFWTCLWAVKGCFLVFFGRLARR